MGPPSSFAFPRRPLLLALLLLFVLLLLVVQSDGDASDFHGSISALHPDPQGMTVSSFRYNPSHKLADWYPSIFGNESVWYNVSQQSPPWMAGASTLGASKMAELKRYGNRLIREGLNIPDFYKKPPPCSIEILAYGRVDMHPPMMRVWRDLGPILGQGSLSWQRKHDSSSVGTPSSGAATPHSAVTIKCYWRALFENWRKQNAWTAPNFWAMVFFCPLGVHESNHHSSSSVTGGSGSKTSSRRLEAQPETHSQTHTQGHQGHSSGHHRTDRLQCTHLERSHDAGTTGGVIQFNLTAALRKASWNAGFTGRLFPSTSPTFNVYLSHHRHKGGRIHKYNGRRLESEFESEEEDGEEKGEVQPSARRLSSSSDASSDVPKARAEKRQVRNIFLDDAGTATGGLPVTHTQETSSTSSNSSLHSGSAGTSTDSTLNSHDADHSPHMAVCCIVPYTSNDEDKARGNGAMLLEWVHYYDKLGFKVFVYDREGLNEKYIRDEAHTRALFGHDRPFQNLHYHNFTIRGLLDTKRSGLKYDNTERKSGAGWGDGKDELRSRYEAQGHDKVNTFTHCRFEAKAVYGIDRVLTVDFDEFLYCTSAPPNPPALVEFQRFLEQNNKNNKKVQKKGETVRAEGALTATAADLSKHIHSLTASAQLGGLQQLMIAQRLTMNKTANTRDCVVQQARKRESIFKCYAAFRYERAGHSIKSLHLGNMCPLTGYHQACPSPSVPRALDCSCPNFDVDTKTQNWPYPVPPAAAQLKCTLFHLSTNLETFQDPSERHHDLKPEVVPEMLKEENELTRVLYGH